jgi:hypothetical protein
VRRRRRRRRKLWRVEKRKTEGDDKDHHHIYGAIFGTQPGGEREETQRAGDAWQTEVWGLAEMMPCAGGLSGGACA